MQQLALLVPCCEMNPPCYSPYVDRPALLCCPLVLLRLQRA